MKVLFSKISIAFLLYLFSVSQGIAQNANCHQCQNIGLTNTYIIADDTAPFWNSFKKRINCMPSSIYNWTNLQTTSFNVYNYNYNGFTIEPTFDNLWDTYNTGISPNNLSIASVKNFASLFRKAVEYRLNGNSNPPASNMSARRIKCIEIESITYKGLCCPPYTIPLWDISVKVVHGKYTLIDKDN
jgi:hypothetical protein